MSLNEAPRKLPTNFIAIACSVLIACGGYMLFSVRYGKPVREANKTATKMSNMERELPGMIQDSVSDAYEKTTAGVSGELGAMLAESEASRESLSRRVVQLEQEIASMRVALQQLAAGSPAQVRGAGTSPQQSPSSMGTNDSSVPSNASGTAIQQPGTVPTVNINQPLATVEKGELRIDVLSARVAGKQVLIEITVTKLTAGDGYFAITSSIKDKHRLVTADGDVIDNLYVGSSPGKLGGGARSVDLISGAPMRYYLAYKGSSPAAPFLARRIEFTAYEDRGRDIPLQFQFDNVAVSD
tara:strand:- start:5143 stop:6036 length:894 start_codon:yes stop_codon:yes gene_type:complete